MYLYGIEKRIRQKKIWMYVSSCPIWLIIYHANEFKRLIDIEKGSFSKWEKQIEISEEHK